MNWRGRPTSLSSRPAVAGLLLVLLLTVASARTFFKYVPVYPGLALACYGVALIAVLHMAGLPRTREVFDSRIGNERYAIVAFVTLAALIWLVYPHADGLKSQMRGSDQDDCVVVSVDRMLAGFYPYAETNSYFGFPCSTGPGMLILSLPFVALGLYPLAGLFWASAATLTLRKYTQVVYSGTVFITVFFASPLALELLAVGSDLFVVGFGLMIVSFGLVRAVQRRSMPLLVAFAVLAGLIGSTRVNFLALVPLLAVLTYFHWRRGAGVVAAVATVVAVVPAALLYNYNPRQFSPLHLLSKGDRLTTHGLKELGLLGTVIGFVLAVRLVKRSIANLPFGVLVSTAPVLGVLSVGQLIERGGELSAWEGANYLMPILPLAVAVFSILLVSRTEIGSPDDALGRRREPELSDVDDGGRDEARSANRLPR